MYTKIMLLAVFSILLLNRVYSQTPSYYHYTSSDGLASSTVYQIIQDRSGFIWVATSNGISRFDGTHFVTFQAKDGLNSNSVVALTNGMNGAIYAGSYDKGISVIKNGTIQNYCNEIKGRKFSTTDMLFDSLGTNEHKLYTGGPYNVINVIHEKNKLISSNYVHPYPRILNTIVKLPNRKLMALTSGGIYELVHDRLIKLQIGGLPDISINYLTSSNDSSYFAGSKGMIWEINNHKVIKQYPISSNPEDEVSMLYYDSHGNLWFSIMHSGFFLIPEGTDQIIDIGTKMGLQRSVVNAYFEDKEGNIWISTMGKGIYCLNNLYIKSYNENDGLISNSVHSIIKDKSGKLLIGTFNGLDIFENNQFSHVHNSANKNLTEYIHSIKRFNTDYYVTAALGIRKQVEINSHNLTFHFINQPSIFKTRSGFYLLGTTDNQLTISKELNHPAKHRFKIFEDSLQLNRINEIFEDSLHTVWIGTNQGLCKLTAKFSNSPQAINELNWGKTFFPDHPVLNSRIKTIFQDQQSHIWVAGEKGVASYNLTNDSIKTYTNSNGYDLSSSTSIASDNKNRIWIGNMKGLFLLDGDSIICLNQKTGLPSNEILSLCFDLEKNMLYVGTSNGLSFLDIDLFDKAVHPPLAVKIISIRAGDSVYTRSDLLAFEPEQHNVSVDFKALTFSSPGSVKYKYKLNDDEWVETDNDFLNFISLKHGKYELQIMAKSQNSNWGKPEQLNFEVRPRYHETTWFKFLRIIFIVLVSVSFVSWRLKLKNTKIRKESELTERINELKHQALSSMMNPHFIFNSLNSVQYLINCHRNEEANDYIAMMAKLIRKNLDTAGNAFILLSEEIFRLKLYLDLEKLRFQDTFSYEIITGSDVDPGSVLIPNMIIQPFVENTLWHGLINSGRKGLITISFQFEEVDIDTILSRSLIIKVTDNGIGIAAARKHKKQDHSSKGIEIIEERLRLLSTKMELPKPIVLEDLSDRSKTNQGTEVIISLPLPLYKVVVPE